MEVKPIPDGYHTATPYLVVHDARAGTLEDPFGHVWTIATHKEDLTQEQVQERYDALLRQAGSTD